MPTVNSNGAAMFALNKMTITERDMTTAMERLSSGKRINHAGDDAAGAAIADRMTAQIKGLEQSVRNAGDVISMAQVTEGALDESSSIIQRIRELAIQSASDVMNAEERSYLDAEVIQMMAELDRVTRDTTFNEIAVLDGSFADRRFQIGTHEREFASLSISSMRIDAIGAFKAVTDKTDSSGINSNLALNAYAVAETSDANLVQSEAFTIHGILGSSSVTAAAGSTVRDIATSVNAVFNATGVGAIASTQLKIEAKSLDDAYNGQTSVSFSIEGKNATAITIAANITLSNAASSSVLSGLRDSINNYTTTTGVLLGDTSATTTDVDGIYSGTAAGVLTIGGRIGTTTPTAFTSSGPLSKATDDNAIATSVAITSGNGFNGTLGITMLNTATVHNSFVTITSDAATDGTFQITGTDLNGDALVETIAVFSGAATKQSTNIFATVTSVIPSAADADADVTVGVLNTIINQAALVTITSSASSETDKTFTVVGTGMDGTALTEVITGPGANLTVTGRQIFRTIHTVTTSAATAGAITIGVKAADSVIVTGQLEMSSSNSFTVVGEDGKGLFELSPGAATLDKLSGVNVKTRQSSVDALRVLDRSLDRIHKERAKLGALMSRMEKAIDNLSNVALNTNASRGRIQDADFAKESARLTKAQILQQSAMAMIAQAGKAQQNVLQLLQQ